MALYVVGYDLNSKRKEEYGPLIETIKSFGTYWHGLDSTWIIRTDMTAAAVRDMLWQHMYSDDRLLVSSVSAPAAWYGFNKELSDWLLKQL